MKSSIRAKALPCALAISTVLISGVAQAAEPAVTYSKTMPDGTVVTKQAIQNPAQPSIRRERPTFDLTGRFGTPYISASGHLVVPTRLPEYPKLPELPVLDNSLPRRAEIDPATGKTIGFIPAGFRSRAELNHYRSVTVERSRLMYRYFLEVGAVIDGAKAISADSKLQPQEQEVPAPVQAPEQVPVQAPVVNAAAPEQVAPAVQAKAVNAEQAVDPCKQELQKSNQGDSSAQVVSKCVSPWMLRVVELSKKKDEPKQETGAVARSAL